MSLFNIFTPPRDLPVKVFLQQPLKLLVVRICSLNFDFDFCFSPLLNLISIIVIAILEFHQSIARELEVKSLKFKFESLV